MLNRVTLGLRARLTIALGSILMLALAGVFVLVYRNTGAQVRAQVDQDLRQDVSAIDHGIDDAGPRSPHDIGVLARGYLEDQPSFGASARLYVIRVAGGPTVTNEPELLGFAAGRPTDQDGAAAQRAERAQAHSILVASVGLHTVSLVDAGPVRLLVQPIDPRAEPLAVVEVGEPLGAVARAQEGVRHAFLLAGVLALVAALAAAYVVAGWVARPVRRIASTAERIDAGELDHRIGALGPRDDVRRLADAFDHMLDRLQNAFTRQQAFVADASHELRTPLTVLSGQIELLALQPHASDEDVAHACEMIETEIRRMSRLVDDLLVLARSDEHVLLQNRHFDFAAFFEALFEALRQPGDRRYEISAVPSGTVEGDPDRIAQVVRNIARNAVEHTRRDGLVRLTATARGRSITIGIEDDGPGIPPEQREYVFDRFHRTDGARSRRGGGSGLGLAIAHAIVLEHGGRIWAEEAPKGGARVAFELPGFSAIPSGVVTSSATGR